VAGRLVSLTRTPEERIGSLGPSLMENDYAPGMCITLSDSELEKLDISDENVKPGEMLHMKVLIEVKSAHHDANGCSICAQIIAACVEDESLEDPAEDEDEEDEDGY
jgi:hypothetical protein